MTCDVDPDNAEDIEDDNQDDEKIVCPSGCTPFEKIFNRTANTRWKNLIFFDDHLDEGKSILSNQRASNWELHDVAEDGYLEEEKDSPSDPEDNLPLAQAIPRTITPMCHNYLKKVKRIK